MSAPKTPNLGDEIEAAVGKLCANSFFPDFVVRSPKYRKSGGQEKEAADVLVAFKDSVLAIQVKSRILSQSSPEAWSEVEEGRFLRVVEKGLSQFRALFEAINSPEPGEWVSSRGTPISLHGGLPKRLFLIVVYALKLADGSDPEFDVRCSKSCTAEGPIPIHIFTLAEFGTLLRMADTFPDFVKYLQLRGELQEEGLIEKTADPLDVWALSVFGQDRIEEALATHTPIQSDGLKTEFLPQVQKMEDIEKPSYLVDWLIHELHASSGNVVPVDEKTFSFATEEPGSLAAYHRIVPFLSQLDRKERTRLAKEFHTRIERSRDGSDSFGAIKFEAHEEAYLFLSSVVPKSGWSLSLFNLGLGLAHTLDVPRAVCIATGPQGPTERGCLAMVVERSDSKLSAEIIDEAIKWFGAPTPEAT